MNIASYTVWFTSLYKHGRQKFCCCFKEAQMACNYFVPGWKRLASLSNHPKIWCHISNYIEGAVSTRITPWFVALPEVQPRPWTQAHRHIVSLQARPPPQTSVSSRPARISHAWYPWDWPSPSKCRSSAPIEYTGVKLWDQKKSIPCTLIRTTRTKKDSTFLAKSACYFTNVLLPVILPLTRAVPSRDRRQRSLRQSLQRLDR